MEKRKYTPVQLQNAVSDVKRRRLTLSKAAQEYDIPKQTLDDHIKGRVTQHRRGAPATLTEIEEEALAEYVALLSYRGFPMTRHDLRTFIQDMTKDRPTKFSAKGPADQWFRGFFARHPQLTVKKH